MSNENIFDRLKYICNNEKINYDDDALKELAIISNGDLRKGINYLQTIYNSYKKIEKKYIYILCDKPQSEYLINILQYIKNDDLINSLKYIDNLLYKGYSGLDIIISFFDIIQYNDIEFLNEENKIKLLNVLSRFKFKSSHGLDNKVQLYGCLCKMYLTIKN